MAVYNIDENLTPVQLTAMHTSFMSHLLVLDLVTAGLDYSAVSNYLCSTIYVQLYMRVIGRSNVIWTICNLDYSFMLL